ncbi:MAG: RHS repeat-associated core domain-containing protein [Prosthecobacter sp.]
MAFESDPDRRAIAKTVDRDGARSSITYDEASGFVKSITNARGDTSTATFTPVVQTITNPANAETVNVTFFDLTRIDHVDDTFSAFVFDTKGNATSSTDRDGDTTTRTFNTRGQTLTSTNPETGVTTFTYDAAANLQTLTDSDTGVTTFGYDTLNRLTSVTHPDTSIMGYTYDALDRTLTRTDERGTVTKFDYDTNSNLTALTRDFGGALQQAFAFAYDALDRLATSTDPAGNATAFEHPYFDSVSKITLPDGSTIRFEYDARRALSAVIDQLGHRTTFQRDEVEQLTATTSPEGRTLSLGRDEIGAVTSVTDPSGDTSTRDLDAFSRTTQSTDPLAREHTLQRDGEGRITGRDEPVSGGTQYEYDDNGHLTRLTDVRGKQWNLTYTAMGRLDTVTDPNAKTWDYDYDTRGRLSQITHPDTVVETRTYDAESHPTGRSFSDGLNLGFTYDALDRLKTTASTPVTLDYDSRGNLTTTTIHGQTFTALHDSRNRLTTLDYAGQMTVTYTYDARGLVTRVTDSLTGAQVDLSYDADRLLTGITRSNGVSTTHGYDTDGKISQITHGALGTIDFNYNAANEPTAITDTGFPVDGGAFLTSASVETQTFDDANQITTHTYDDRGRPTSDGTRTFTWDSADRLISVVNGGSTLAYDYTATGQITSRTLNGQTTDYCYAYSVASQPILAERKSAAFTRFYVALPDGRLLYQIDLTPAPAVRFYHFGKVGETRFLTDAAGAVTDAYAYDGHGRLLGKTGASDQIYAFTGQLGVRHDPEANLVHMRARHYDPVSGRFLSRDPIHLALMGRNGQHANAYHFVEGMVTSVVDPSGLDAFFNDLWEFSNGDYEALADINASSSISGAAFFPGVNFSEAIFDAANRFGKAIAKATALADQAAENAEANRFADLKRELDGLTTELIAAQSNAWTSGDIDGSRVQDIQDQIDEVRRAMGIDVDAEKAAQREASQAGGDPEPRYDEVQRRKRENRAWFNFFFPW